METDSFHVKSRLVIERANVAKESQNDYDDDGPKVLFIHNKFLLYYMGCVTDTDY